MRCEVLIDPHMAPRGKRMIEAMVDTAPMRVVVSTEYKGHCDILLTYGMGHPKRRPWWKMQLKAGRHVIGTDLGYWRHKDENTCRMRFTLDAEHPHRLIRAEPPERFAAEQITLRNDFDPDGPVILVGLGDKSAGVMGYGRLGWERRALKMLRETMPGRTVLFRPKRDQSLRLSGCQNVGGVIEDAIRGASLVVCRHSNVAVDACIAGIPVKCEDGAAVALYRSGINPTLEARRRFLESLAWWQWKPEEAKQTWTYLLKRLSSG